MLTDERIAFLVARSDPALLDIGANDGAVSRRLGRLFPGGTIFAFEPDWRAAHRFRERADNPRARLFRTAVGREVGRVKFYQSGGVWPYGSEQSRIAQDLPAIWDQSGSTRRPKEHHTHFPWVNFDRTVEVAMTTLDAWNHGEGLERVDLIWADVRGAEADLIEGARGTLRLTRYLLIRFFEVELYKGAANLKDMASKLSGFRVLEASSDHALFENEDTPEIRSDM